MALLRQGYRIKQVAKQLNVSYYARWRLMKKELPQQMQSMSRVLTAEQVHEAYDLLATGMTIRAVARHFNVSHSAIWRLTRMPRKER
ncbi:MAG: helix-turn-helix domain-containing protein [Acidobacteriales bacterium]|nr:helix-turn-helix domain-containing protein [Terriglobales bacterium]